MEKDILLADGAKVMPTCNLWTSKGLVPGCFRRQNWAAPSARWRDRARRGQRHAPDAEDSGGYVEGADCGSGEGALGRADRPLRLPDVGPVVRRLIKKTYPAANFS